MKTEPEYHLDDFEFYDKSDLYSRFAYALSNLMSRISKTSSFMPPIKYRRIF